MFDGGDLIFQIAIWVRVVCFPAHANAGRIVVCFGGRSGHIGITRFQALFKSIRANGRKIIVGIVGTTLDVVFTSSSAGVQGAVQIWARIGCWSTCGSTRQFHSIKDYQGDGYDDELYGIHLDKLADLGAIRGKAIGPETRWIEDS